MGFFVFELNSSVNYYSFFIIKLELVLLQGGISNNIRELLTKISGKIRELHFLNYMATL